MLAVVFFLKDKQFDVDLIWSLLGLLAKMTEDEQPQIARSWGWVEAGSGGEGRQSVALYPRKD